MTIPTEPEAGEPDVDVHEVEVHEIDGGEGAAPDVDPTIGSDRVEDRDLVELTELEHELTELDQALAAVEHGQLALET